MQIIQIVPRLPPSIDGVGDYAFLLAKQLRAAHDIHTTFVVCDPNWGKVENRNEKVENAEAKSEIGNRKSEGGSEKAEIRIENPNNSFGFQPSSPRIGEGKSATGEPSTIHFEPSTVLDGFAVHQLKERSAGELLRVLLRPGMPQMVLLQYVGYGYEKRGCPVWLVRGLEKWRKQKADSKKQNQDGRKQKIEIKNGEGRDTFQLSQFPISALPNLVTMFHELYASGPVWRSSFWTSPLQRWIAKSLARMSGHCFTNLNMCGRVLKKFTGGNESPATVLPVFSNVGEPEQLPDWNGRKLRMIVFGSASQRRKVYFSHLADLEKACQAMGLEEIVDIGAPFEIPQLAVRVSQRGILPAPEVSREMLAARAGFFAYPTAYLGKSGVFAAYAAHGLVPVTFSGNVMENEDGLKMGEHFITPSGFSGHVQKIGEIAHEWYLTHSVECHAKSYKQCMS
jgi:hypothetical protein